MSDFWGRALGRTPVQQAAAAVQYAADDETWVHDGIHLAPLRPAETGRLPATPAQAVGLPSVWACVDEIVTTIVQLDLQASRGGQERPLPEWLRRPDRFNADPPGTGWTLDALNEHLTVSMALHGAGYLWAEPLGDSWALWPINPTRVWVEYVQLTDPADRFAEKRRYRVDGQPADLARRWTTRANTPGLLPVNYRTLPGIGPGVGPIQAARLALGGYLATDGYGADVFSQGVPPGFLTTEQDITENTAKRYQKRWHDPTDGPVRVLGAGLGFEHLRLSPKDAAWIEARQFNAREVARLFGMPPYKLGLAEPGGLTYQNGQDLDRAYLRDCITRYTEPIQAAYAALLPPGRNADEETVLDFSYAELLRPTTKERYESNNLAVQGGWMTVDEIRAEEGLPPMPTPDPAPPAAVEGDQPLPFADDPADEPDPEAAP